MWHAIADEDCPLRITPSHIAVGGFSAGATIAAGAAQLEQHTIKTFVNFYAISDLTYMGNNNRPFDVLGLGSLAYKAYIPKVRSNASSTTCST